ncbi:hypothetical protein HV824_18825 [Myxococcus sp. AM009]|uniref:hypothetical protein n=1 Tax=unclassified Myxococcus TaxID=2648731 RepID=UPI001595ED76|nr:MULTISPECIES: hypothetical protein [unclassified Myxococcus]NVJ00165.1 hypothetical protein [Myxococcus sp. AM009]NVJ18612.1 hypothetical protein [Myxococcus sp. AM010]
MPTWMRSAGLAVVLSCGLWGCGGVQAPEAEAALGETSQELIIPCSVEDDSACRNRRDMICDYNQSYCVFVCSDGSVCPTHRYCCN